jgi:hypothetical protein
MIDTKSKAPPLSINLTEMLIKKSSQNVITFDPLSKNGKQVNVEDESVFKIQR